MSDHVQASSPTTAGSYEEAGGISPVQKLHGDASGFVVSGFCLFGHHTYRIQLHLNQGGKNSSQDK